MNYQAQREAITATIAATLKTMRKCNGSQDMSRHHARIARLNERLNELSRMEQGEFEGALRWLATEEGRRYMAVKAAKHAAAMAVTLDKSKSEASLRFSRTMNRA